MMINLSDDTVKTIRNGLARALKHLRDDLKRAERGEKKHHLTPHFERWHASACNLRAKVADMEDALSIFEDTE
jgi:hypothetical protein